MAVPIGTWMKLWGPTRFVRHITDLSRFLYQHAHSQLAYTTLLYRPDLSLNVYTGQLQQSFAKSSNLPLQRVSKTPAFGGLASGWNTVTYIACLQSVVQLTEIFCKV